MARFYRKLGFIDLHGPYDDPRFVGSPSSLIMLGDIAKLTRRILEMPFLRGIVDQIAARYQSDNPSPQ
jgi:hypothetical protein